jgi:hypothetical protein
VLAGADEAEGEQVVGGVERGQRFCNLTRFSGCRDFSRDFRGGD